MFFLLVFISYSQEIKKEEQSTENKYDPVLLVAPNEQPADSDSVFTIVEVMPQFPGGNGALLKYILDNIQYPKNARKTGTEGDVYVTFMLDREGKVTEPKVLKGVSEELDAEAIRVVSAMPQWTPGTQNGKPVMVQYNLPVRFKL